MSELGRSEVKRGGLFRRLGWIVAGALALTAIVFAWIVFEGSLPEIALARPLERLGEKAKFDLTATDSGTGLASVDVWVEANKTRFVVSEETFAATGWRGSGVLERSFALEASPREAKVPEGEATLVLRATDHSWRNLFLTRETRVEMPIVVDFTPPSVEVLTLQHYMRLGGSDLVVYRTSDDTVKSGVEVDRYFFPGIAGALGDPKLVSVIFAVPQDLTTKARPRVVAEDAAGNRREVAFHTSIKPQQFRERTLDISDEFLQSVIPDLLRRNGLPAMTDLVAGYLEVNRNLRLKSEERIKAACAETAPHFLWKEPFLRQPNSAPLSHFADRRTYEHKGEKIDTQTHLGFDLASLRQSPVTATNDGKVVLAENLGIYGDTVILDHGMGIFSLYGHLSSIAVAKGDSVKRGQSVGNTGATGLAGGDHLHFSMMIRGTHVDPVEWWDPKWVRDHVTEKIAAWGGGKPAA